MYPHLKAGFMVRHPTVDDIAAIIGVMAAFDVAEVGEADKYDMYDILSDWGDLDPARDAWVVTADDGMMCGYATLTVEGDSEYIVADGYVHPAYYGQGIGTTLIELMEARAEEIVAARPDGRRQVLVNNILVNSPASRGLLEARGYRLARVYFRMHITLDGPPPPPVWPEGIIMRFCDGSAREIRRAYETIEEGFRDHWAHTPRSFEDWQSKMVREGFEPKLWFLAQDGDEIAGAALCRAREEGLGWVEQLAVRRRWRKQGLGLALLRLAFGAFYARGIERVGLGVDGQSLTGAQRLYERAGMQVTMRIGRYEKVLGPGTALEQS